LNTARRLGGYDDEKSLTAYTYQQTTGANPFLPHDITYYPSGLESVSDLLATRVVFTYYQTGSIEEKQHRDLAQSLPLQSTTYVYSADGRFLRKKTNTAGHETNYEYNSNYGFLTKETDCNGLVTRHVPTPLGITSSVYYPDGTDTQSGTSWVETNDTNAPEGAAYYKWSLSTGKGESRTYYDATGAKLRTVSHGMTTELVFKDYIYNEKGLVVSESLPYFGNDANAQIYWTNYRYDNYNRLTVTEHPDGLGECNYYQGLTTQHVYWTDPNYPACTTTTVNVVGWTVESTDEDWNAVQYDYNADGSMRWTQIGSDENTRINLEYDDAGNRIFLIDPNYGQVESRYNAYGQLVWMQTPKGNFTNYGYDNLGRMVTRFEHDVVTNKVDSTIYGYSGNLGKLGLLDYISFNGKQQYINYTYDNLNRLIHVSEMRQDIYYFTSYTYDFASRVSSVTYPTGFQIKKEYTATGHLSSLTDSNHLPLWRTLRKNAAGQIESYMTGDSLVTNRSYDPETGRLLEILTLDGNDTIQENSYDYDIIANLAARTDHVHGMREDFIYDKLNRLTGIVEGNDTTACFDYDAYGRMLRKYMHSTLVFDSASYNAGNRPHAIAQAKTINNLPTHRMSYTHFDKLSELEMDTLVLSYNYGFEHQRLHMTETNSEGDTLWQKEYVDNCEYVIDGSDNTALTYLCGPLGIFGVQEERGETMPRRYFIHPDHLGSWTLVTDHQANIVQDVMYDVWGTPYSFTATGTEPANSLLFDRGFTGHEHLLYFGLINMNGRMYDPFTSGFLSVDNYVQSPDYTQSFNRYAYCLNNPLKYTDPDGEFWHIIIGAAIGGIANLASGLLSGQIDTFGEGLAYFGIGAAAGALSAGVGAGVSSLIGGGSFGAGFLGTTAAKTAVTSFASGSVIGASSGLTQGFVLGAGNSWMQGANFGQGLLAGAKAGGKGFIWGAIGGGLAGGIDAAVHGRDFLSGDVVIKCHRDYPIGQDYQQQPGSGDCAIKSGKAIHDFDNDISISSSQIRKDLGLPCSGGVSDVDYWNAFGDQYGYDISRASTLTDDVVSPTTTHAVGSFNDGAHVALSNSQSGTDITHTVLIRQTETRFHTTWGRGAHVEMSYKYWVQNPTTGCMDPTPYSSVGKVVNMFIIRKR
jgi:RHS repeat-associated protein